MAKLVFLTNTKALATRQRLRGKAVDSALKAEARAWGDNVRKRAEILSRGTRSKAQLRMYHPGLYSVARQASFTLDATVNAHGGPFAGSWRVRPYTYSGGVTVTVLNISREAAFMMGTERTRKRPILEAARGQFDFARQMREAKRRAESSGGGSLLMELVQVGVTVGMAYGGAAFG